MDKDEVGKKRKKKEASLVVDASLPNPQPECIQSTYDFYRQQLAKRKRQRNADQQSSTHLAGAATTQSANEDVCDSTTEPGRSSLEGLVFLSYWSAYTHLFSRYGKTTPPVVHDVSDF